ncbi:MAG: FAD-dependent oxidoreductase [Myxococcales bacterium]|nr:FAD-dependent oxidoreductase [Myxococcales bacterium]
MKRRLSPREGEWIDRSRRLRFSFEGGDYEGYAGDLINSALLANGLRVIGRSFKYHRPRGLYSLANHDANGLFCDARRTHIRGDQVALREGLSLRAVNTVGGLRNDWMRFTGSFARFMPVGFYYKGFFKPRWAFPFHERQFRRLAGLGEIRRDAAAPRSPKEYAWCDVLVVGSGPSGISAALAASEAGAKVLLVDEQARIGGSLHWLRESETRDLRLAAWLQRLEASRVEVRCGTIAAGAYADHWIALVDDEKLTKLRAKAVVYATGTIEQPAVFHNNDLPGVMLASAAQRLIHQYAVKPFDSAVLLVANVDGYRAATDLLAAGVAVRAIADLRADGEPTSIGEAVEKAGVAVYRGFAIRELLHAKGKTSIAGAVLCPLAPDGSLRVSETRQIPCDGAAVSVGNAPNAALLYQEGAKFGYDASVEQLVPNAFPTGVFAAGRVNGIFDLEDKILDGERAGLAAARETGHATTRQGSAPKRRGPAHSHPYPIFSHPEHKNFVDFDEDVPLRDIENAHQEGYDSVELLKRYTTLGMGPSQGKLSSMNAVRVLARLNGASVEQTGTTTSRPLVQPVPLGHMAGRRFHPMRQTPMHDWHEANGAHWVHAGVWYRPEFYRRDSATREDRVLAEAQAVRTSLGLIDVSTLGKLWVMGPDAAELLDRVYTGRLANLPVGRQRYGVALDESGVVIEDGVIARTAENRFYVTTTSGGVAGFFRELQRWALVWKLDVSLMNATGHVAAMNLAGPRSRDALAELTSLDLSSDAFPYLGVRDAEVAGVRALALRVGFVGELGYELHVPASQAMHVWKALLKAGARFDLAPFGVEAQRLLRLEKGHLIVGHDSDALSFPREVALAWAVANKKPFFVGKRSLAVVNRQPLLRKLAGIRWNDGYTGPLPEECQLVIEGGQIAGRVTSVAPRSTLGYPLGMAFVRPELAEPGTRLSIRIESNRYTEATVTPLCHYDPDGTRQKA